jgi:hypothetical protein
VGSTRRGRWVRSRAHLERLDELLESRVGVRLGDVRGALVGMELERESPVGALHDVELRVVRDPEDVVVGSPGGVRATHAENEGRLTGRARNRGGPPRASPARPVVNEPRLPLSVDDAKTSLDDPRT